MRPRHLGEVVGQPHLTGQDCLLPRLIEGDQFGSLIFWGPPGCGKTSIAEAIATQTRSSFVRLNAVLSNVAELRDCLKMARYRSDTRTILFIDELHRFNKAQQDLLLPDVEQGHIRLIGATTHNPGFTIIGPLLSRSHLFKLDPISVEDMETVLQQALVDGERGLGHRDHTAEDGVLRSIAQMADGDLRRALNALETLVLSQPLGTAISLKATEVFARERHIRYDRDEDEHYDTASAFIKSIRGGDPDAALYWLAKMRAGGEDPRFIARRLVILASEDIGLADSRAILVANATFDACERIGLPECELNLAHAVVFLATCPKSNRTTLAWSRAQSAVEKGPLQPVPTWIRDKHGLASRAAGHARDYRYSHDWPEAISGQEYMVEPLRFFEPGLNGAEPTIAVRLERWRQLKAQLQNEAPPPT